MKSWPVARKCGSGLDCGKFQQWWWLVPFDVCVWPVLGLAAGLHRDLGAQGLRGGHTVPSDTEDRETGLLCVKLHRFS